MGLFKISRELQFGVYSHPNSYPARKEELFYRGGNKGWEGYIKQSPWLFIVWVLAWKEECFFFLLGWRRKWQPTPSSVLVWRILWTGDPDGLPSMGLHRVRYDWRDLACMHACSYEAGCQSSPVSLPTLLNWDFCLFIFLFLFLCVCVCVFFHKSKKGIQSNRYKSLCLIPARRLPQW